MIDPRLAALQRTANALSALSGLSPPQLIGAQLAVLASSSNSTTSSSNESEMPELWQVAYEALQHESRARAQQRGSKDTSHPMIPESTRLLWYHAALHSAFQAVLAADRTSDSDCEIDEDHVYSSDRKMPPVKYNLPTPYELATQHDSAIEQKVSSPRKGLCALFELLLRRGEDIQSGSDAEDVSALSDAQNATCHRRHLRRRRANIPLPLLAAAVAYEELDSALQSLASSSLPSSDGSSALNWILDLLRLFLAVVAAPGTVSEDIDNNGDSGSEEEEGGECVESSTSNKHHQLVSSVPEWKSLFQFATVDEETRATACRLCCLIIERASRAFHIAAAVAEPIHSFPEPVPVMFSAEEYMDEDGQYKLNDKFPLQMMRETQVGAFQALDRIVRGAFGPFVKSTSGSSASLVQEVGNEDGLAIRHVGQGGRDKEEYNEHINVIEARRQGSQQQIEALVMAWRRRRRTLMVELLPTLFPATCPRAHWMRASNTDACLHSEQASEGSVDTTEHSVLGGQGDRLHRERLKDFWCRILLASTGDEGLLHQFSGQKAILGAVRMSQSRIDDLAPLPAPPSLEELVDGLGAACMLIADDNAEEGKDEENFSSDEAGIERYRAKHWRHLGAPSLPMLFRLIRTALEHGHAFLLHSDVYSITPASSSFPPVSTSAKEGHRAEADAANGSTDKNQRKGAYTPDSTNKATQDDYSKSQAAKTAAAASQTLCSNANTSSLARRRALHLLRAALLLHAQNGTPRGGTTDEQLQDSPALAAELKKAGISAEDYGPQSSNMSGSAHGTVDKQTELEQRQMQRKQKKSKQRHDQMLKKERQRARNKALAEDRQEEGGHISRHRKKEDDTGSEGGVIKPHLAHWMAFLAAYEVYEREFELHLVDQVWSTLPTLGEAVVHDHRRRVLGALQQSTASSAAGAAEETTEEGSDSEMNESQKDKELYKMTENELTMATSKTFGMNDFKQYCIEDLEYIVKNTNISLRTILKTQHLTPEFCKIYLLNDDYVVFDGDDIMIPDILKYQPHIKEEDLTSARGDQPHIKKEDLASARGDYSSLPTDHNTDVCFWEGELPPFSAPFFRLLLEASLRNDNATVVKHGLERFLDTKRTFDFQAAFYTPVCTLKLKSIDEEEESLEQEQQRLLLRKSGAVAICRSQLSSDNSKAGEIESPLQVSEASDPSDASKCEKDVFLDPTVLFPPSWLRRQLVQRVLDDGKLYKDYSSQDAIGGLVRFFFLRLLAAPAVSAEKCALVIRHMALAAVASDTTNAGGTFNRLHPNDGSAVKTGIFHRRSRVTAVEDFPSFVPVARLNTARSDKKQQQQQQQHLIRQECDIQDVCENIDCSGSGMKSHYGIMHLLSPFEELFLALSEEEKDVAESGAEIAAHSSDEVVDGMRALGWAGATARRQLAKEVLKRWLPSGGSLCSLEPALLQRLCDRLLGERFSSLNGPMRAVVLCRLVPLATLCCDTLAVAHSSILLHTSSVRAGDVSTQMHENEQLTVDRDLIHEVLFTAAKFLAMLPATTIRRQGDNRTALVARLGVGNSDEHSTVLENLDAYNDSHEELVPSLCLPLSRWIGRMFHGIDGREGQSDDRSYYAMSPEERILPLEDGGVVNMDSLLQDFLDNGAVAGALPLDGFARMLLLLRIYESEKEEQNVADELDVSTSKGVVQGFLPALTNGWQRLLPLFRATTRNPEVWTTAERRVATLLERVAVTAAVCRGVPAVALRAVLGCSDSIALPSTRPLMAGAVTLCSAGDQHDGLGSLLLHCVWKKLTMLLQNLLEDAGFQRATPDDELNDADSESSQGARTIDDMENDSDDAYMLLRLLCGMLRLLFAPPDPPYCTSSKSHTESGEMNFRRRPPQYATRRKDEPRAEESFSPIGCLQRSIADELRDQALELVLDLLENATTGMRPFAVEPESGSDSQNKNENGVKSLLLAVISSGVRGQSTGDYASSSAVSSIVKAVLRAGSLSVAITRGLLEAAESLLFTSSRNEAEDRSDNHCSLMGEKGHQILSLLRQSDPQRALDRCVASAEDGEMRRIRVPSSVQSRFLQDKWNAAARIMKHVPELALEATKSSATRTTFHVRALTNDICACFETTAHELRMRAHERHESSPLRMVFLSAVPLLRDLLEGLQEVGTGAISERSAGGKSAADEDSVIYRRCGLFEEPRWRWGENSGGRQMYAGFGKAYGAYDEDEDEEQECFSSMPLPTIEAMRRLRRRRVVFAAIAQSAWSSWVETGKFSASTADALAKLLFQPSFISDPAIVGAPYQWCDRPLARGNPDQPSVEVDDEEDAQDKALCSLSGCFWSFQPTNTFAFEDLGSNLLASYITKFEAIAERGRPQVLRSCVSRLILGLRVCPVAAGRFLPELARLLQYAEVPLKLNTLPSEQGPLSEGLVSLPHSAPSESSSAVGAKANQKASLESLAAVQQEQASLAESQRAGAEQDVEPYASSLPRTAAPPKEFRSPLSRVSPTPSNQLPKSTSLANLPHFPCAYRPTLLSPAFVRIMILLFLQDLADEREQRRVNRRKRHQRITREKLRTELELDEAMACSYGRFSALANGADEESDVRDTSSLSQVREAQECWDDLSVSWAPKLAEMLLDGCLDRKLNVVNPMVNTASYGRRLRSFQALNVLAPLLAVGFDEQDFSYMSASSTDGPTFVDDGLSHFLQHRATRRQSTVQEKLWAVLEQPVLHTVRFYQDLFAARIYRIFNNDDADEFDEGLDQFTSRGDRRDKEDDFQRKEKEGDSNIERPRQPNAAEARQASASLRLSAAGILYGDEIVKRLTNSHQSSAQVLASLITIAGYACMRHLEGLQKCKMALQRAGVVASEGEQQDEGAIGAPGRSFGKVVAERSTFHRGRLHSLLAALLPLVMHSSTFVRTVAQLLAHKLLPLFQGAVETHGGPESLILRSFASFLDNSRDMVRLRRKQGSFLDRLVPLVESRVGVMLSHGDEFNEIAPMSLVELVSESMRELYDEATKELGSSHSAFADHYAQKELREDPSTDEKRQESDERLAAVENVQRKIRAWWDTLELGAGRLQRAAGLSGAGRPRQTGLIVCATLVDKIPNLAGLTRTAEIFGASSLALPNLQVVSAPHFKQISVTAEGWVPLEEVRPPALLEWLLRRKREGYAIVGLEQTAESLPLAGHLSPSDSRLSPSESEPAPIETCVSGETLASPKDPKGGSKPPDDDNRMRLMAPPLPARTVLLLGREKEGIPVELLRVVDRCVEIPQLGVVRSLNVHVSGAIAIWEFTRQHRLSR